MLIFSKVRLGVTPDVNALAALIIAIVSLGVLIAGITMRRRERQASQDDQRRSVQL
jgi:putrescine transport system permease protein